MSRIMSAACLKNFNWLTCFTIFFALIFIIFILLLIPDNSKSSMPLRAENRPFTWNQDSFWKKMETMFLAARNADQKLVEAQIDMEIRELYELSNKIGDDILSFQDPRIKIIESKLFNLSPNVDKPQPNRNDLTLKQRDASHQASESS